MDEAVYVLIGVPVQSEAEVPENAMSDASDVPCERGGSEGGMVSAGQMKLNRMLVIDATEPHDVPHAICSVGDTQLMSE